MKFLSSLCLLQTLCLVQLVTRASGESSFLSSIVSFWSSNEVESSSSNGRLRNLSLVSKSTDDDSTTEGSNDDDSGMATKSVASSTGHGGVTATVSSSTEDEDTSKTTASTTSDTDDTIDLSYNGTDSNSTTTDGDDDEAESAATETPTLSTDDILALLGDDAVQNATLVIPMEKEQPRGWALDVIIIFLSGAILLFVGTFVKQWRKRQSYSHVPTSLVV